MYRNSILLTLAGVFALATDQWSKAWAIAKLEAAGTGFMPVISPWFNLQYAENRGINFGLLGGADMRWVLTAVSIAICVGVLFWLRDKLTARTAILAGLLIGGALGNVYDRITQGFVTDFINNSLPNWHNPFSYNVADIWVFVGLIGLVIWTPEDK